jgi:hypothetical protein
MIPNEDEELQRWIEADHADVVLPTEEEIEAAMTPAGGWTKATLASWGVPWPPPKGWRKHFREVWELIAVVDEEMARDEGKGDPNCNRGMA